MIVIHIAENTPSPGFEFVELIANRVSRKNHLSLIKRDGMELFTGGFILNDTPSIRSLLDSYTGDSLYGYIREIRQEPFVKFYSDEP